MRSLRSFSLFALAALIGAVAAADSPQTTVPTEAVRPVHFSHIRIHGFWKEQTKRLTQRWIPHCIRQMEAGGAGQELLNLVETARILRGEPAGKFKGRPWSDAYVYNTIEAICLALAIDPQDDADLAKAQQYLRQKLDEWIPIVLAAQMPDGYIHSYHVVNRRERYSDTSKHEFYVQGYFLEAGVAHYQMTGGQDRRLYDAARKCADHLCSTFGPPPKRNWIYGHPGMGCALCRLARLVNEVEGAGKGNRYAQLARFFFDNRHADEKKRNLYAQSHLPVVEQKDAVGHAVRATYFYTGVADLAMLTGDVAYLAAVDRIWKSATERKMYVTGGVGSTRRGEAFGQDFELPNDSAYCESCAGCGLSFWSNRMHRIHGRGSYVDVQERVLYNNILGAIELAGERFFYQNPLSSHRRRDAWHGCPCCVGNIPRALLAIKDLLYAVSAERDTLYVDHFVASEGTIAELAGSSLKIVQHTDYPWKGDVTIVLEPADDIPFTLKIRIPNRSSKALYTARPRLTNDFTIKLNGKQAKAEPVDGYVSFNRKWKRGDRIELLLPMDIQRIYADRRVEADRGRVALQRGPLVYNVEDVDHDGQSRAVFLSPDTALNVIWSKDLLGGVMAIQGPDKGILAIPNYARLNRGGWSLVWLPETRELAEPYRQPTIASTSGVSTSYETHEGRLDLTTVNDGRNPEKSDERGTPILHWWPHRGTVEWVQYAFREPATVSSAEVFWYDDRAWGACRVPQSWRLLYRDASQWKPVSKASGYGVELDQFNRVTFTPVTTNALRLEVRLQKNHAAGVLEWRVGTE